MKTSFTIPGRPFAKQRPRFGGGRAYTPKATMSFEATVRTLAAQEFSQPYEGPVSVSVTAIFKPAKSWSKAKRQAALDSGYHTQKPDLDNLVKAVCDGMNRVAYADDAQIVRDKSEKRWGERDETIVVVEALT